MKKIIILFLFGLLSFMTINNYVNKEEQKNNSNTKISAKTVTKKESLQSKVYYVSCVKYVSHDDYFTYDKSDSEVKNNFVSLVNNEEINTNDDMIIPVSSNEESKEEMISDNEEEIEKEIINDNKDVKKEVIFDNIEEITESNSDNKETKSNENQNEEKEKNIDEIQEKSLDVIMDSATTENTNKGYYSPSGKYLGEKNVKVIDVSYYQKDINWDKFYYDSDCYGVILRLGYWTTLDKKFERNISELKRLNIPYGIYLFSYATTINGAKKEADFTNQMIDKYQLDPILGIYYDIESWNTKTDSSNNISKDRYDDIITTYVNEVSIHINYKNKVKVYSGRWYANNRLNDNSRTYVDWVAEYNSTCKYNGNYSLWQYTSKGSVPGIEGNVDISYIVS